VVRGRMSRADRVTKARSGCEAAPRLGYIGARRSTAITATRPSHRHPRVP
jgi:hypothetical protein